MKSLIALVTISLLVLTLVVGACGKSGGSTDRQAAVASTRDAVPTGALRGDEDDDESPATATLRASSKDNDADFDNDEVKQQGGYHDSDDAAIIRAYGRPAAVTDKREIASLVERYYAAAAKSDGTTACALLYSTFEAAIAEDYGQVPGPSYARGTTCPVVISKIFQHMHATLAGAITVTDVRVRGLKARALFGSATAPAGVILVRRERGVWKIGELVGEQLL